MTISGIALILLIVFLAGTRGRSTMDIPIAIAAAFPQTAGLIVGGTGIPMFYVAVLLTVALLFIRRKQETPSTRPFVWPEGWLVAFLAWSLIVTFVGTALFAGMGVYTPRLGIDAQVGNLTPLALGPSNSSQLIYLTINVILMVFVARKVDFTTRTLHVFFATGLVVAVLNRIVGRSWSWPFTRNMPGVSYVQTTREAGSFSEPSYFAMFLVAALAFYLCVAVSGRGASRAVSMIGLIAIIPFLAFGEAGTALSGVAILAVVAVVWTLGRVLFDAYAMLRTRISPAVFLLVCILIISAAATAPVIAQAVDDALSGKLSSGSFRVRAASDGASMQIFLDTWGLGVGLGSNRPSSFTMMLLSCVGIVGVLLLVVALLGYVLRSPRSAVGAKWALIAALCAAALSVPDLSNPTIWICLLATGAIGQAEPTERTRRSRRATPAALEPALQDA